MQLPKQAKTVSSQYHLDETGCFVIENYNHSKVFSNFFPGVADVWGIPMWVFYVNRGQCISSFGIESKDKAILEFQPANKAYRLTTLQGFRTFLKIKTADKVLFWEPFQNNVQTSPYQTRQRMLITAHDLTIEDINKTLGIVVKVNYFTVAQENYPALVRHVVVENVSKKKYEIEMLDGLSVIMPYGLSDWAIKNMSRTVEAWVKVRNVRAKAPYYHLNVEVSDTPDVRHIHEGNFYFSFDPGRIKPALLDIVVEGRCIFGNSSDFRTPECFLEQKAFAVPSGQQTSNRTPSAMTYTQCALGPGDKKDIVSLVGYAHTVDHLKKIVRQATKRGFFAAKKEANRKVVDSIKHCAFTNSSSREFNQYCMQTFLDNVLRGGLPVSVKTSEGKVVFNVFSRKHGDPERDYNYFVLAPTFFSQGNGNYRDVNQNRRNDVWFHVDVKDSEIVNFFNLLQADGYNPLIVKGMSFVVTDPGKIDEIMVGSFKEDSVSIRVMLMSGFQPGELLSVILKNNIPLKINQQDFLGHVLGYCRKQEMAEHGEGFWSDHWTYNIDLIESYLGVFPESLRALLLERKIFSFYHNDHYVAPQKQRYVLTDKGVRQYYSVKDGSKEIRANEKGNKLRALNGEGDVYYSNLLVKMLCLVANKISTLDPSGVGIEMEADKPNWYDALNGLPGLLGSSISETLELKRYSRFLLLSFEQLELSEDDAVTLFEELCDFIRELVPVLREEQQPVSYWQKANEIKEHYRSRVRQGIVGQEHEISIKQICEFLELVIARVDAAVERAQNKSGLITTYFYHEVTDYDILEEKCNGCPCVMPKRFKRHDLPLFLEGFVHALRVEQDPRKAAELFYRLRKSELLDKKLKMYKVNAGLSGETEEIGRTRIFPPGWLENESIWLHMEYKYMLELLRCGLYKEFFDTFSQTLVPFLDPEMYGRSTLENSSFLVSSAHEDQGLHGQGFVARLSGSTAEFLHMWLLMNVGKNPFTWDSRHGLCLEFKPVLPGWLFSKKSVTIEILDRKHTKQKILLPTNTYAFRFLGRTLVVYHNPKRKDTHGLPIREIHLAYPGRRRPVVLENPIMPENHAQDVRNGLVDRIDLYFG